MTSRTANAENSSPGFTLTEALVGMTILAVCAAAVLLGIESSIVTTQAGIEKTIGQGLALQLMDEIAGRQCIEAGTSISSALGPEPGEAGGASRANFDDVDDYHAYTQQPPCDRYGQRMGHEDGLGGERSTGCLPHEYLDRWRQTVTVEPVAFSDLSQALTSGGNAQPVSAYRAVTVVISIDDPARGTREAARVRRVFAYVPSPP
jgi:prepilin-type N-terminal cleavage/methylation domain-containing protein